MKLSKHFDRSEFMCRGTCNCGCNTADSELVSTLEIVRTHFGLPVRINSAFRCLEHNRSIGSKDTSMHVQGKAADIQVKDTNPETVYNFINRHAPNTYGLGLYIEKGFVHVDVRSIKARWEG